MRTLLVSCIFAVTALLAAPQAPQESGGGHPCLTLGQVEELSKTAAVTEDAFRDLINQKKLCFAVTGELIDRLRGEGAAAEKLLALSNRRAEDLAGQQKPVDLSGSLMIQCSPPECSVDVGRNEHGETKDGRKEISGIPPGTHFVSLSKQDPPYVGKQLEVTIETGKVIEIRETLEPSFEAKLEFGKDALAAVIEALGGRDALAETMAFTAGGEINVFDTAGAPSNFAAILKAKLPNIIAITTTDPTGKKASVTLDYESDRRQIRLKGKPVPFEQVQHAARSISLVHIASLLDYIESRGLQVLADTPLAEKPRMILARSQVESIVVVLDASTLFPVAARRHLEGVGTTEEVRWHSFVPLGRSQFPRHLVLTFSPDSKEGVEFDLRQIDLAPNLTAKDFK